MDITDVQELRQLEVLVPGPDGANRFVTIAGLARISIGPEAGSGSYTFRVGPVFEAYQVLGVSCLPSIAALELDIAALAECALTGHTAEFDVDSGRIEVALEIVAGGAVKTISVVFSVTILVAA